MSDDDSLEIDRAKLVSDPSARPILRATGETSSERRLAALADKSFLNLWSYPNVFIDKKANGKGDGKELCDLLIVCGDHVLIFSDKLIAWPEGEDQALAWRRWARRAIEKSVAQIRGAERWIANFPERIFLDKKCTQRLPLPLPPIERRKVHGIAVALGAGDACKRYFGEGNGSLMVTPSIMGAAHWHGEEVAPFAVGDVSPEGSFIHVLDDATLDIVLGELDTITDLTSYLSKKESLIRSGRLVAATGEEDLVAYYMTHLNKRGHHDFVKPDGSDFLQDEALALHPGFHADLVGNPQYIAKKEADKASYVWDRLIEAFTTNILGATTLVPEGQSLDVSLHEQGVRHMAIVPRYVRRLLGQGIFEAVEIGKGKDRFTRALLPGPAEDVVDTAFFFMTLRLPANELKGGYEQYRQARRNILETYALTFLRMNPHLERVVGIGTEPPGSRGSSEDLIHVTRPVWTEELVAQLDERRDFYSVALPETFQTYEVRDKEFPDVGGPPIETAADGLNRRQRRALQKIEAKRRKGSR
jgi:hypothetical protein